MECAAARIEEARKINKYKAFLPPGQETRFIPFVLEASGRLGERAEAFIDELAGLSKGPFTTTNPHTAECRRYFQKAVQAAMVKGNYKIIQKYRSQIAPVTLPSFATHIPPHPSNLPPLPLAAPTARPLSQNTLNSHAAATFITTMAPRIINASRGEENSPTTSSAGQMRRYNFR